MNIYIGMAIGVMVLCCWLQVPKIRRQNFYFHVLIRVGIKEDAAYHLIFK